MDLQKFCVNVGGNQQRHTVLVSTEKCVANSYPSRIELHNFVTQWFYNMDLLQCGDKQPQSIRIWHDGNKWTIEAEAISEVQRG